MAIQIDTAAVTNVAESIAEHNREIYQDFQQVQRAMNTLSRSWSGSAADAGIQRFDYIEKAFKEPRFQVVDNFVSFLRDYVEISYDTVERNVTSAADAFK